MPNTQTASSQTAINTWVEDNYYRQYPDHILGKAYLKSGRFGSVTRYEGDWQAAIAQINKSLPEYVVAQTSPSTAVVQSHTVLSHSQHLHIQKEIEQAQKSSTSRQRQQNQLEKSRKNNRAEPIDLLTFQDVDRLYNAHLSEAQKQVFVYYMNEVLGRPMLGGWFQYDLKTLASKGELHYADTLKSYVLDGLLCDDGTQLLPPFIFESGNVYERKKKLEHHKAAIVERSGEATYERQHESLANRTTRLTDNRLRLDAKEEGNRLRILPNDQIAQAYQIETLGDEQPFRGRKSQREDDYGKMDFKSKSEGNDTFASLSLQTAFLWWLKSRPSSIQIGYGFTWADLWEMAIKLRPRRESEDPTKFQQLKKYAKSECERLFSHFLAVEIKDSDRTALENAWNQRYVGDVPMDYNQVPIGFALSKFYAGLEMDIRAEKREAIAAAMMQGSLCLAYGVGLGKTWCAIFIMAQFMENGWCSRPLLTVPKQVYPQFVREIKGILPQIQVNELGNLSVPFLNNISEPISYHVCGLPKVFQLDLVEHFVRLIKMLLVPPMYIVGTGKQASAYLPTEEVLMTEELELCTDNIQGEKLNYPIFFSKKTAQFIPFIFVKKVGDNYYLRKPDTTKKLTHFTENLLQSLPAEEQEKFKKVVGEKMPYQVEIEYKVRPLAEKSISVVTHQGFKQIGLSNAVENELLASINDILAQENADLSQKQREAQYKRNDGFVGRILRGTVVNLDELGIDYIAMDEAHAAKKIFTSVKGEAEGDDKRGKKSYELQAGQPSAMGIKTFALSQYIQTKYGTGNVLLLTATPFTNSPLEVYSMLVLVAYKTLKERGLHNLKNFFDKFVRVENELVVTASLNFDYKEIFTGFADLTGLQTLIRRYFLYKQQTKDLKRPNKIVLPQLGGDNRISTILPLSALQQEMMAVVLAYAEGEGELPDVEIKALGEDADSTGEESSDEVTTQTIVPKVKPKSSKPKVKAKDEDIGVRILKSVGLARALALSPYLFQFAEAFDLPRFTYKSYIEESPKLLYTMNCIRTVKEYHESRGEAISGQIIYMNVGVAYFPLIQEYLVKEVGFKEYEVGIIKGTMPTHEDKAVVQDKFLGRKFNNLKNDYEPIPDEYRVKVLIGSASITEGINLQTHCTVIYNLYLPWNPTDTIQLEGRGWRQGNLFKNIRIVYPLMQDSMDVFMFQKLEEKTVRINQLWNFDNNQASVNLAEFNAAELKYAIIRNPTRLAQMEAEETKSALREEKSLLELDKKQLLEAKQKRGHLESKCADFIELSLGFISKWKLQEDVPEESNKKPLASLFEADILDKMPFITRCRYIKKHYLALVELAAAKEKLAIAKEKASRSYFNSSRNSSNNHPTVHIHYSMGDFTISLTLFDRLWERLLKPRGIGERAEEIQAFVEQLIEPKLLQIKEEQYKLGQPEYIEQRAAELEAERQDKRIIDRSLGQRVEEFATLNYLLAEKRMVENPCIFGKGKDQAKYKIGQSVKVMQADELSHRSGKISAVLERTICTPMYRVEFAGGYTDMAFEEDFGNAASDQEPPTVTAIPSLPNHLRELYTRHLERQIRLKQY